jgi:hypothetical protein
LIDIQPNAEVRALFKEDPIIWGKHYFPHYFRKKSPDFHIQILRKTLEHKWIAIQAPRGSAKSTIETFLMPVHGVCFGLERFIVILQNTYAKACASLENIKSEIRHNELLKSAHGVVMTKDAEGDSVFRVPNGEMCRILCKGADQIGTLRGERFGAYRPTLVVVDDLEDDELVRNAERRRELEKQFNEVLNYVGEQGETRIVVGGTILHDDSLLAKLVSNDKYRRFKKLAFHAIKDDGTSLWPEKWSLADLKDMERNDPIGFAKEMMGDPVSGEAQKFHKEDFRYWRTVDGDYVLYDENNEPVGKGSMSDCRGAIACDLAWEMKRESDFSVILPGYMTPQNDLLIDSYICKRGQRPNEYEESIFEMSARMEKITGKSIWIGLEKAKLEKVMRWWLGKAMQRRGKFLMLKDLVWDSDKLQRIYTRLEPRYANHAIYHKHGMGELELQLLRIPSGAHDDLPDAMQALCQLLAFRKPDKKVAEAKDAFSFWRKQTVGWREKNRQEYVFGRRGKEFPFKTIQGF